MILLKRIKLNNFLSHKETTIKFNKNDKILIDGSSGAGKSSIFDAIIWALYGQGRANNKNLVRVGAKNASVSLEIGSSKESTIIIRKITKKGKHTLNVFTKKDKNKQKALPLTGVKEIQNWIDKDLIGASYLLFINSVAYMQGNTDSFVVQTAQKRKELLLEIIKAESYKNYYQLARKTLLELENDKSGLMGRLSELNAAKASHYAKEYIPEDPNKVKEYKKELKNTKEEKSQIIEKKELIRMSLGPRIWIKENIDGVTKEIDELKVLLSKIDNINIENPEVELRIIERKLSEANEINKKREELMNNKPHIVDRGDEIKNIKNEIKEISEKPKCPSGEECPYYKDIPNRIIKLKKQLTECNEKTVKETKEYTEWLEKINLLGEPKNVPELMMEKNRIGRIIEERNKIPDLKKEIKEKTAQIEKLKKDLKKEENIGSESDLFYIEQKIDILTEKEEELTNKIIESEKIAEIMEQRKKEVEAIKVKINDINNNLLPDYEKKIHDTKLTKDAFAPRGGIETMIIDYLLPKLEDKINEILSKLSDFRVRLDTQRIGADNETTIEGLFITILNEKNEEMPFEAYSGGEKLKILVSISESLATLQKVNFRLFDETFIGLDENSTESFSEVLQGLQRNFNQILCISHLLQIKELFNKKINIIKNNNISSIK